MDDSNGSNAQRSARPSLCGSSDEGRMSNKEIHRCLKRYIVRELYPAYPGRSGGFNACCLT